MKAPLLLNTPVCTSLVHTRAFLVVLHVIYLAQRRCASLDELCEDEMSFSMMPHLSI